MSLRSIFKSYKVELNPSNKQKEILNKNFGCTRFAYNWCVNRFTEGNKKEERLSFSIFNYIIKYTLKNKLMNK